MSGLSYASETPYIQALPSGTYKVSCSIGDQSKTFRVVADPGYTTCILWDGTNDGYSAVTMVEGTGVLLAYEEPENLHDDHTVVVDPEPEHPADDSQGGPAQVIDPQADRTTAIFQYVSALVGVIAAFLAGLLIMKGDDEE